MEFQYRPKYVASLLLPLRGSPLSSTKKVQVVESGKIFDSKDDFLEVKTEEALLLVLFILFRLCEK